MKTKEIFKKVGHIIAEINEQYEYLSVASENLNDLELELLSANADFLAEHIKVLRKLNAVNVNLTDKVTKTEQTDSAPASAVQDVPTYTNQPDTTTFAAAQDVVSTSDITTNEFIEPLLKQEAEESYFSFQSQPETPISDIEEQAVSFDVQDTEEEEVLYPQNQAELLSESEDVEDVEAEELPPSLLSVLEPQSSSFAETSPSHSYDEDISFSEEETIEEESDVVQIFPVAESAKVLTLNELIAAQRAQNSSPEKFIRPITDLKSIINLNDKLVFIKDLFNGYSLAYSEAIEILNRFDTFDAADNFLKTNYALKNNWPAKQNTADKFYELLNRRFSK